MEEPLRLLWSIEHPRVPMSEEVLVEEIVSRLMMGEAQVLETRMRLLVQPRPWWLPQRLWVALLQRVLTLRFSQ